MSENRMDSAKPSRIQSVAVYLASQEVTGAFRDAVIALATYLAEHRMTLVFGGSNTGAMKLLADTALAHGGKVTGVFTASLPSYLIRDDLTGKFVAHNLAERKAEMLRRADAIIALPGSYGTWDELCDALAQIKLAQGIKCPIGVLNVNGFYDPLLALIENSVKAGFTKPEHAHLLKSGKTVEELFAQFTENDGR